MTMEEQLFKRQLVLMIAISVFIIDSTRTEDNRICRRRVNLSDEEIFTITFHNLTGSRHQSQFCVIEVISQPSSQILLHLDYMPNKDTASDCHQDYVLVGNEKTMLDKETVTSYKYCWRTYQEEIISRKNYLWVVIRSSLPPSFLKVEVAAHWPVECPEDHFQCSPLQCLEHGQVCDGIVDCQNGRDEFCRAHVGHGNNSPEREDEPCFQCIDGTYISPRLARYNMDYGKVLWYLCDGIAHCPDGSDERKDLCFRLLRDSEAVIQCIPVDANPGDNASVVMWGRIVACDGILHCKDGQDERLDRCQQKSGARQTTLVHIQFSSASVGITVVALGSLIAGATLVHLFHKRHQESQRSNRQNFGPQHLLITGQQCTLHLEDRDSPTMPMQIDRRNSHSTGTLHTIAEESIDDILPFSTELRESDV